MVQFVHPQYTHPWFSYIIYTAVYGMENNKINEEIKKTKQGVGEVSRYHV